MELSDDAAKALGKAIDIREILGSGLSYKDLVVLCRSARSGNIKILRSHLGLQIGYIAYAKINSESVRRVVSSGEMPKFFYEWNEGYFTYIVDVAYIPVWSRHAISQTRRFIREQKHIIYIRNGVVVMHSRKSNGKHRCVVRRNIDDNGK